MALRPLTYISLCTGGGGLDLGLELAIPAARAVCLVERESFAAAHLVAAMQAGLMAPAPVWSDVTTFRGRSWRGSVDWLIGGIPCQPWSHAGRRGGAEDERDLWCEARRIVNAARPWGVLIENVEGMLSGPEGQLAGAARVRRDLAAMGYRVEGVLVRAAEVGAPHERARVFILGLRDGAGVGLADASRSGLQGLQWSGSPGGGHGAAASGPVAELRGAHLGDPARERRGEGRAEPGVRSGRGAANGAGGEGPVGDASGEGPHAAALTGADCSDARGGARRAQPERRGDVLADAIGGGHGGDAGASGRRAKRRNAAQGAGGGIGHVADADLAQLRGEPPTGQFGEHESHARPGLWPPGPEDRAAWGRIARERPDLLPATTQSRIRGVADDVAPRVDQLRLLGNGVVPAQAAWAIRLLLDLHARNARAVESADAGCAGGDAGTANSAAGPNAPVRIAEHAA